MLLLRHHRVVWMGALGFLGAAGFAACAIDEGGTLGGPADSSIADTNNFLDNIIVDAPVVDNYIPPPTCSQPDASLDASCLGKPIPDGWRAMGIQLNVTTTCPGDTEYFDTKSYFAGATLDPNACNCSGCAASGDWSCNAVLKGGGSCTSDTITVDASTFCWANEGNHTSYGEYITRTGSVACSGGMQQGNVDASGTPITACVPTQCESDFCGLANVGYTLCIANSLQTDGGCPSDFPNSHLAGLYPYAVCATCEICSLSNAEAGCTGAITAYNGNNCDPGTEAGTSNTSDACAGTLNNYSSLGFVAGSPPTPNCGSPTGPNNGVAELAGPLTICCP